MWSARLQAGSADNQRMPVIRRFQIRVVTGWTFGLRGRPDVGDLMPPRRRHRLAGQARAAAAARRRWAAVIALIRVIEGAA